jgi:hypothetical protein
VGLPTVSFRHKPLNKIRCTSRAIQSTPPSIGFPLHQNNQSF